MKIRRQNIFLKLLIYIFSIIIIAVITSAIPAIIILTESQILYAFSSSAQVTAGLYGLTLAGYVFYHSNLDSQLDNDNTLEDQIATIKLQSYENQLIIGTLSLSSIFMSISTILIYNQIFLSVNIINFILNFTTILFFVSIYKIIRLSLLVIEPNKIKNVSNKLKEEIENSYLFTNYLDNHNDTTLNLSDFFIPYGKLLNLMKKYVHELCTENKTMDSNKITQNNSIIELAKILNENGIISNKDIELINMFRKYRNALAHGGGPETISENEIKVGTNIAKLLNEYYIYFEKIFNARKNEEERKKAYSNLEKAIFDNKNN